MKTNRAWVNYLPIIVCLVGIVTWVMVSHLNRSESPDAIGISVEGGRAQRMTIDVDRWTDYVNHTFVLINQGSDTIVFAEKPVTSCGCADATLSKIQLQPGDHASLELDIKLKPGQQSITALLPIEQPANAAPLNVSLSITAPNTWQPSPRSQEKLASNGTVLLRWKLVGELPADASRIEIEANIPDHMAKVVSTEFVDGGLVLDVEVTRKTGSHILTKGEVVFSDKATGFRQSSKVLIRHPRRLQGRRQEPDTTESET